MASIGLSKPYISTYTYSGSAISYGTPAQMAKAVEVSIEADNTDPVVLYADNGVAESVAVFSSGTLTLTVDELELATVATMFGLNTTASTTPAGTTLVFPADNVAPFLGFGVVRKYMKAGEIKYEAIVLPKIQFQVPGISASTQGETVEFETPELTANIYKDDASTPVWVKRGVFATEANAVTWLSAQIS